MIEERLIEVVKKHPELYDTKHENYSKAKVKTRIWNDIAEAVNLKDGEAAKNMWLKLRSSFRDARRRYLKQLNMLDSSASNHPPSKPWRFHTQMSFLEAFMSSGNMEKNSDDVDNNDDSSQTKHVENGGEESQEVDIIYCKIEEDYDASQSMEYTEVEPPPLIQEEISNGDTNKKRMIESPPPLYSIPKRKKKGDDINSLISLSMKMREERARQREAERKKLFEEKQAAQDPLRNFFMSMYLTTKNMPAIYQHNVRIKVFQAVTDAEAQILNLPNFQSELPTHNDSNLHSTSEPTEINHEIYVKEEPFQSVNNT